MSKKLLLLIVFVAVVAMIFWPKPPIEELWVDNKLSASYPKGVINEDSAEPTRQLMYIDVTGSMTPYYVQDKRASVVNAMSAMLTLIPRDSTRVRFLGGSDVYQGFANDILQKAYSVKDIKNESLRRSLLSVTNFDKMFRMAVDSVNTAPGTIVYLLTDGIQSLSKKDNNMAVYLNELRGSIKSSFSQAKNVACAIYRYSGEFNGTFINCRETKVDNQHLQRPFYIIAFGHKNQVRWLANKRNEELGNPNGKLYIGTHDYDGHKRARSSHPDSTRLEKPGGDVTLILNLPPCMENELIPDDCLVTGVANPSIVKKEKNVEGLRITLPAECGIYPDATGLVTIRVSMPNKIKDEWLTTWSTDDDTSGPDSITTFGLSSLVKGIVDGLQPDSVFFQATFRYIPQ